MVDWRRKEAPMPRIRLDFPKPAVTIIAGEEPTAVVGVLVGNNANFAKKILEIDKKEVMGGGIHALKKAITTVIKAIEHMREIEVSLTTNSISTGNGVNEFALVL